MSTPQSTTMQSDHSKHQMKFSHDHTPQEIELMQAVYRMNSQQFCSLGEYIIGWQCRQCFNPLIGDEA